MAGTGTTPLPRSTPDAGAAPEGADRAIAQWQRTIDRARQVGSGTRTRDELAELAAALRAHIGELLPVARSGADRLWRGGTDWYRLTARLDSIQRHAGEELGDGVLATHVQVRLLALDCQWLLERHASDLTGAESAR
ncbi:DUF6415 family natural product biosynthesis protein [Streptomyces sp. 35G-GA-8]|uniref:DUF6415 family natural product biosynthesis protein n=1 Tax=Streptomyces sp. 35G-GA-8 TaxID=2939434 RepID=UPI00201EC260|nr:DUF6415 family natural product biosynthesis protein [Streptomyces sp. 35G-GA-8]MCL7380147.1 DUF6415 family natural product biosynthesis protein [Streptomyces sp. 35G-GA-8]